MADTTSPKELEIYQLEKVFKATDPDLPPGMFVDRQDVGKRFAKYLRMPSRPLALVGPYRCGKTCLAREMVRRQTERQIYQACKSDSTFDLLLIDAFDDLSPYYPQEVVQTTSKAPAGLSADFWAIKANIGAKSQTIAQKESRALPPQLTSRALAKFAAAADAPWIIDDVHKLQDDQLKKVAEVMREWQTLGLPVGSAKVIVIGTDSLTSSLHSRLVSAAPDLEGRLAALTLKPMTASELREIAERGGRLLNVDFSAVSDQIAEYSFGLPNVCHDLCFHACDAAGVDMTQHQKVQITSAHLQEALEEYISHFGNSIKDAFTMNLSTPIPGLPRNFAKLVLDRLATKKMDGMLITELTASVSSSLAVDSDDILAGLDHLANEDTGVIRVEEETVYFKVPMYLVYFSQRTAAAAKEPAKKALANKFREIMRTSTTTSSRAKSN